MRLRDSWLFRIGVTILILGSAPLILFIIADKLGFIADPNPNPIGLGLLLFVTAPIGGLMVLSAVKRASAPQPRDWGRDQWDRDDPRR